MNQVKVLPRFHKLCRNAIVIGSAVAFATVVRADTTDLDVVTTAITSQKTALVTAAAVAVGAGLTLMAIKFGGKWLVKVWKSFAS